jgi:hypothetical protein
VVVVLILIFAVYYLFWVNPIITSEDNKISAAFEIIPSLEVYTPGSLVEVDGSDSSGKDIKYNWIFDDDFVVTEGNLKSKRLRGYFVATKNEQTFKSITLTVSNSDNEDTVSKDITIMPSSFKITEERLGDSGKFKVDGSLDISNPDGIINFHYPEYNADVSIYNINVEFETPDLKPMSLDLTEASGIVDGFQQSHSVFKRTLIQDLLLSGTVSGTADVDQAGGFGTTGPYPIHSEVDGTMYTKDLSYTDLTTYNTIFGQAENELELTMSIQISNFPAPDDLTFTSNDDIKSYPDLRNDPMNIRLVDLADNNGQLKLDDGDAMDVGNIIYRWDAEKIEYLFEQPVIMLNLSIDQESKDYYNLEDFFLKFWIAEGISQPVKTQIFSIHKNNGNTTTLDYSSLMIEFVSGTTDISDQTCPTTSPDGHFLAKRPNYEYSPEEDWTYIPPTGTSNDIYTTGTSFDGFTIEQAITLAQSDQDFKDFKTKYPDCYVVSGSCSATGDNDKGILKGILAWNLTFGATINTNDPDAKTEGLNIIVPQIGSISTEVIEIDVPPNAVDDFEPLLTFAGSEDIFLSYSDEEFHSVIFKSDDRVDFDNVNYGIETNLQYPNLEITSIMFVEHSKYSYLVTYNKKLSETEQRIVSVALDAETGQLLFYLDHTDNGLTLL